MGDGVHPELARRMDLMHDRRMPEPIDPHLSHTAYRRIYDHDGLPLPGRFALEFVGPFVTVTNQPETATKVARTVCQFSGTIQPPPDVDLLIKNANGDTLIKLDQDGLRFFDSAGGEPRPTVSAARTPRDLELEAALVALGLITVGP